MGDRLRIYFSEKSPGIFRFAPFLPLEIPETLHPLEILQNCACDTPYGNPKPQGQKPRPMEILHDSFLNAPGNSTSFLIDPMESAIISNKW